MSLEQKKKAVKEFADNLKQTETCILTNYQGLDVNSLNELRQKLKDTNFRLLVVKNRLVLRSIDKLNDENYDKAREYFKGPTALLLGKEDPSKAIKIFKEYSEETDILRFKGGVINENYYDDKQIGKIAGLPSRKVLLAKTANVFNAPI
ncbi:MAG: 50S ribosomal protein L10, partial [Elusimicrobiota bacterium]